MSQRTDAHVIPESVGGKLSAIFLCKRCNSDMGKLEGQLPRDVVILGLVDRLDDVLPTDLVNSIRRHGGSGCRADHKARVGSCHLVTV